MGFLPFGEEHDRIVSRILLSFILLLMMVQPSSGGESEDFSLAKGAYSDGLFEIAGKQFAQFVLKYPRSSKILLAHFYLAECEFRQGHFSKARDEYALASKSDEIKEKSFYTIGKCFFGENRFDEAISSFERFMKDYPESKFAPSATYWLGEAFFKKKEMGKAHELYLKLLKEYPDSPYVEHARLSTEICSIKMNKPQEAISSFKGFLSAFPDSKLIPSAQFWLGGAYLGLGKLKKAQVTFEKIMKNFPESEYADDAQYAIGLVSLRAAQHEKAIESFQQLAKTFPESQYSDDAHYQIAHIYGDLGKTQEAEKAYHELIENFPEGKLMPFALYNLGACYTSLDNWEKARSTYERLLSDYPDSLLAQKSQFQIARYYHNNGNLEEAEVSYQKLLQKFPDTILKPLLLFQLGNIYFSRGEFDKAIQEFAKLKDRDFEEEWQEKGHFYVAASLFKSGKHKETINEFKLFIRKFPASKLIPGAVSSMGESFYLAAKYKEARTSFEKAIAYDTELKDLSHQRIGDCFFNEGLLEEAIASYNRVKGKFSRLAKFRIGSALYQQDKFKQATPVFQSLINMEDYLADDAQYWFSGSLLRLGKVEEAERGYQGLVERFPGSELLPATFFNMGNIYYRKKAFDKAIQTYEKLTELFPQAEAAHESHFWMGLCQFELGNSGKGKVLLEEYISFSPGGKRFEDAQLWLAKHYYGKKEFDNAKKILLSLFKSPNEDLKADAHYWMGRCFESEEKYDLAQKEFNEIVKHFPDSYRSVEAWLRIANLLNLQNKHEKALGIYEKITKKDVESEFIWDAFYCMGETLQKLSRYREAIRTFEQIRSVDDEMQEAKIQFRIAECYQELGELEEAVLEYLKVAYLYSAHSDWALRAQECAAICLEKRGRIDDASKLYSKILEADPDGVKGELARQRIKVIRRQRSAD